MMEAFNDLELNIITKINNDIESLKDINTSYIDTIISYCENNNIEIETFGTFVKTIPSLKSKLQEEAESLNIIKKTSRLPL